jgi:hypothetical protein
VTSTEKSGYRSIQHARYIGYASFFFELAAEPRCQEEVPNSQDSKSVYVMGVEIQNPAERDHGIGARMRGWCRIFVWSYRCEIALWEAPAVYTLLRWRWCRQLFGSLI